MNQTLEQFDIKSVNFFLAKISDIWMGKAKKNITQNRNISEPDLIKIQRKYKKMVSKLQKQKYSETSHLCILAKFKLMHLINAMIFATQDYYVWLQKRLKGFDS